MQKYKIRITSQAKLHLKEIRRYYEKELLLPEVAKTTVQSIRNTIRTLEELPARAPVIEEQPWGDEGIRKIAIKNYLIYFWIDETRLTVQIIAVIHEKMDQAKQLKNI